MGILDKLIAFIKELNISSSLIGLILGIVLNEVVRRGNRVEIFNNQIFNERVKIFAKLYKLIYDTHTIVIDMIDDFDKYDDEEWNESISDIIFSIANFTDKNQLFLSDELALQCCSLYMGLEDENSNTIEDYKINIVEDYKNTLKMIKNESGINRVNKKYKQIIKYKHNSPIIQYYKHQKIKYRIRKLINRFKDK